MAKGMINNFVTKCFARKIDTDWEGGFESYSMSRGSFKGLKKTKTKMKIHFDYKEVDIHIGDYQTNSEKITNQLHSILFLPLSTVGQI